MRVGRRQTVSNLLSLFLHLRDQICGILDNLQTQLVSVSGRAHEGIPLPIHTQTRYRGNSHSTGVTLISTMIKKVLINRNDSQFYHSSVKAALSWRVKSTNGSRCSAVAGQCDVKMNQDWSFSEAAELSRATAAKAGSLSSAAQKEKTQPRRYKAEYKGPFSRLIMHQHLRQRSSQFKQPQFTIQCYTALLTRAGPPYLTQTAIFKEKFMFNKLKYWIISQRYQTF